MRRSFSFIGLFSYIFIQMSAAFANCDALCDQKWWANAKVTSLNTIIDRKNVEHLRDSNGATPLHFAAISNSYPSIEAAVYEIQIEETYKRSLRELWPVVRDTLRPERPTIGTIRLQKLDQGSLVVRISKKNGMPHAVEVIKEAFGFTKSKENNKNALTIKSNGDLLIIGFTENWKENTLSDVLEYTRNTVERRLIEIGKTLNVASLPTVNIYDRKHLILNYQRHPVNSNIKSIITQRGHVSFNPVISVGSNPNALAGAGNMLVPSENEDEKYYTVVYRAITEGSEVVRAFSTKTDDNKITFSIVFNQKGSEKISAFTKNNIGAPLAIILDGKVVSAPVISNHISDGYISISGNLKNDLIYKMTNFLNVGSLPSALDELLDASFAPKQSDDRLQLLIDAGADLDAVDKIGQTAMHWAAKSGSPSFLRLLIDNGGDPTIRDVFNKTPFDYTTENPRFLALFD